MFPREETPPALAADDDSSNPGARGRKYKEAPPAQTVGPGSMPSVGLVKSLWGPKSASKSAYFFSKLRVASRLPWVEFAFSRGVTERSKS
jgi:hypothetical protein